MQFCFRWVCTSAVQTAAQLWHSLIVVQLHSQVSQYGNEASYTPTPLRSEYSSYAPGYRRE